MKITRQQALEMTAYCRRMGLKYTSEGSYSIRAGLKRETKAPNGVRIHFPRDWIVQHHTLSEPMLRENPRVYVLWFGEPLSVIEEACAYILMVTRDKEIYVIRASNASLAAEQGETQHQVEVQS